MWKQTWFILMDRATLMKRGVRRTLVRCAALTEPYVGGLWLRRIRQSHLDQSDLAADLAHDLCPLPWLGSYLLQPAGK